MQIERNCSFLDNSDIDKKIVEVSKAPARKYDLKFRNKTKLEKEEDKAKKEDKERTILQVLDYEFYSCPMATLTNNRGLTALIDLINWSSDMHTPLLDGGLLNHSNYYFECYRTVISEQKKIENEEMKKSRNEAESKRKKQKTATPRGRKIGRAGKSRRR